MVGLEASLHLWESTDGTCHNFNFLAPTKKNEVHGYNSKVGAGSSIELVHCDPQVLDELTPKCANPPFIQGFFERWLLMRIHDSTIYHIYIYIIFIYIYTYHKK